MPSNTVICLGEALADFVPEGKGHVLRPGGAPANVAVNLSRLGVKSRLVTRVGSDFLGGFLLSFLKKNKVDISSVKKDFHHKTGLVFVFLKKNGERDFSFYGAPSADAELSPEDIKPAVLKNGCLLHFGSISMMAKKSALATLKAVKAASQTGMAVSFDPNIRLNLWCGRTGGAREATKKYFKYADIIKISDKEFEFLYGQKVTRGHAQGVFGKNKLVLVSKGAKGCEIYLRDYRITAPAEKVKPVDTTGAGDAFMAGALSVFVKSGKGMNLGEKELVLMAKTANHQGARAVVRKGAV